MKKILSLILLSFALTGLFCGCASNAPLPESTRDFYIAVIQTDVPLLEADYLRSNPSSTNYFKDAAAALDVIAAGTNFSPGYVLGVVTNINGSAGARAIAVNAVLFYKAFVARSASALTTDDQKLVIKAIADALRAGLPPATLDSLRGFKTGSKQRANNCWAPAASKPGAPSGPKQVWNLVKDPFVAKSATGAFFSEKETTLSISGVYTVSEPAGVSHVADRGISDGTYGFDIETTYWVSKYIGAGVDIGVADIYHPSSALFTYTAATINARLPIGPVAPYAEIAMGRNFDAGTYYGEPRLGLEVRISPRVGVFGDVGYQFVACGDDALQTRFGVRWAF